ncbi:MAG: PilZ domain-containing protein [Deltaproteobacteria bacterium]|nr:PilZ domain-containing protein [Deltaproteobacteria bacterium]
MLKIECTKCREWINSPFLPQLKETTCPHCSEVVPVKDICISTGSYAIQRDVLLKNFFKYKSLLEEVQGELDEMLSLADGSKPFDASAKTVMDFMESLKGLMDGCRDTMRTKTDNVHVTCRANGETHDVEVLNISTTGVRIALPKAKIAPKKGEDLQLYFTEEINDDSLIVKGKVMWANEEGELGVQFSDLNEATITLMHDYIMEKLPPGDDTPPTDTDPI